MPSSSLRSGRGRRLAQVLGDLAWPTSCAGCGRWDATVCRDCLLTLEPQRVIAQPVWWRGPPVHSALLFDGPARSVITAFKDEGRTDLRDLLVTRLRAAVAQALGATPVAVERWCVVAAPSSPRSCRRRGRFPLGELSEQLIQPGLTAGPRLIVHKPVRDQAGLDRQARRENVCDAYRLAAPTVLPAGTGVVLVDDVATTGATLAAAASALAASAPRHIVAATIVATGGRIVDVSPAAQRLAA